MLLLMVAYTPVHTFDPVYAAVKKIIMINGYVEHSFSVGMHARTG